MAELQAALTEWAVEKECTEINIEDSNAFAKIWMWAAVGAVSMLLPLWYWTCVHPHHHRHVEEDDKKNEHLPPPSARGSAHADDGIDWDNPQPDLAKARAHLKKSSCTNGEGKWLSILGFPVSKMNEIGGTGIELYFKMLRTLGYAFAVASAFSLPLLGFNLVGNFAPDTGNKLTQSTIGNLGLLAVSGLPPEQRYVVLNCQGLELSTLTAYFGWLDFFGTCAFLAFVLHFRFVIIPRARKNDDKQTTTCRDFAVVIDHLPPFLEEEQHERYEELLKEHLQAQLQRNRIRDKMTNVEIKVCEVSLVRDMDQRLSSVVSRAEMIHQRDIAEYHDNQPKVDKLNKKIEKVTAKLGDKLDEKTLPVLRAYAILNTPEDVNFLLQDYRFANFSILRCCQRQHRRFQGSAIKIRRAPEPTDIIWENQDLEFKWRVIRKVLMFCIFLVIISLSLVLIYLLLRAAKKQTESAEPSLGISGCDAYPSKDEVGSTKKCNLVEASAWNASYAKTLPGEDLDCYCATQGYDNIVRNGEIRDTCLGWLREVAVAAGIMGMFSMAVVLINVIVKYILIELANFERPLSMSSLNTSMMVKVAVVQILNMSLIVTLVDWHAPEWIQTIFSFPLGDMLFRGYYNDIVRGWYARVGSAILLNMLLNTFTASGSNAAMAVLKSFLRCWCRGKMKHQAELIAVYTNPEFEIATRYAQLLATVFCSTMYSSGLPLLNLFAVAFMFVTYWTDKTLLLWFSKRPPMFDAQMAVNAANALVFAAILHCCVAVLMFGQQCTFPSEYLGGSLGSMSDDLSGQATSHVEGVADEIMDRFRKQSTWMLFTLAVVLIAVKVLWLSFWILGGSVGLVMKFLWTLCPQRRKVRPEDVDEREMDRSWAKAFHVIERTFPPASYRLERMPEYRQLARALQDKTSGSAPSSAQGTACEWREGGAASPSVEEGTASLDGVEAEVFSPEEGLSENPSEPRDIGLHVNKDGAGDGAGAAAGCSEA